MIIDARSMPDGTTVEAEVCIVGAGAAGITLANELAGHGVGVILLESGGQDFESEVQDLCDAEESGARAEFDFARLRQLGGSTGHWGGNCAPFLAHELAHRPWVPDSGWPFGLDELAPYFARAADYCQFPADAFDPEDLAASSVEFRAARLPLDPPRLVHKVFRRSPPTRFGEAYRAAFEDPRCTVKVFLHAHTLEIETDDTGSTVTSVATTDLRGHRHRFAAKVFVLAAGPENARLMLLSNRARPNGIGNDHDNVGRYFMGHLTVYTGQTSVAALPRLPFFYDAVRWRSDVTGRDVDVYVGIQPSPAVQERERILSCTVFLETAVEGWRSPGVGALRRIVRLLKRGQVPGAFSEDLGLVAGEIDRIGYVAYQKLRGRSADPNLTMNLRWFLEQAPNRDSRLRLGSRLDPLGQPRLRMDWNFLEIDKLTLLRTQDLIAREFGRLGIGRVQAEFTSTHQPWPGVNLQAHFMGGTRMHPDPRRGVVDPHCRVHGVANLYVAGGSVFPTSGSTMPTANIVALAIRLADHLVASNHAAVPARRPAALARA